MKGFLFQVSNTELGDADKAVMMNNKEMKKNKKEGGKQ
jgi:hypothetical protein